MRICTIGFTKHTAEEFFDALHQAQVTRLIDVRLHNVSQLAGFAKRDDLRFFLQRICGIDYVHEPLLAPTQDLLDHYRKEHGCWETYESSFRDLLRSRQIESSISRELFSGVPVLLCSEHSPVHCHRRVVAEYLDAQWGEVEILHLH